MFSTRAPVLVLLAVVLVVPLATTGAATGTSGTVAQSTVMPEAAGGYQSASTQDTSSTVFQADERPDDPATNDTIGYVAGYWYDDSLPVDDRAGAHVSDEELEAVVYRSMARVETIRNRTFETTPAVEVITREEFRNESAELFVNVTERERVLMNVQYEALMMVERDRDAVAAYKELYGGAVAGYYEPASDQIVLVSDDVDTVEVDEITLGHELVHALQDQRFGLEGFNRSTMNREAAINGLVEGDASFVDEQYREQCDGAWTCLEPQADQQGPGNISWGQFFALMVPYQEGPEFVEHVYERGGWDAVDALYDEPPASASEIIHADVDRKPIGVDVDDSSTDEWSVLDPESGPTGQTVGEAGMVSIFLEDSLERRSGSVLDFSAWYSQTDTGERYDYGQPITDGWAGDELVVYTTDEETVAESGFVWKTAWTSSTEAREFYDGYLELLSLHGAEPVDGRADTYRIDAGYPGSYYVVHDDTTVTIVRAPSTDELTEIRSGAAPEDEDPIPGFDPISGFGVTVALAGLLGAVGLASRRR